METVEETRAARTDDRLRRKTIRRRNLRRAIRDTWED